MSGLPLTFGAPASTPPPTDPTARLEAQLGRLERVTYLNLLVAGLLLAVVIVILI